jgi:hypothetical protein
VTNLPEPSTSDRLSRIASQQRAVRTHLEQLRGTVPLTVGGEPVPHSFDGFAMRPVMGIAGLDNAEMAVLPAPPGQSITLLRCPVGACCQDVSVPQALRVLMVRGALLWWQESLPEPIRLEAGEEVNLAPGELHSFTALSDETLNYNFFTPSL